MGAGSWQFCTYAYLDTLISGFLRKLIHFTVILRILRNPSSVYPYSTAQVLTDLVGREPAVMAANSNSAAAKRLGLDAGPSPATPQPPEESGAKKKGGWREKWDERGWEIRPKALKVKFKVKELERLYKNSVFRSKQSLLFWASVLMAILSFLTILTYLGQEKVSSIFFSFIFPHSCELSG